MKVKLMRSDGRSYTLYDHVEVCTFHEQEGGWAAKLTDEIGASQDVPIEGAVYLMNEDGNTFDRFVVPA